MQKTCVLYVQDSTMLQVSLEMVGSPVRNLWQQNLNGPALALLVAHKSLDLKPWVATEPRVISWACVGDEADQLKWEGIDLPMVIAFASLISGRLIRAEYRDGESLIPRGFVSPYTRRPSTRPPIVRNGLTWVAANEVPNYLEDKEYPA